MLVLAVMSSLIFGLLNFYRIKIDDPTTTMISSMKFVFAFKLLAILLVKIWNAMNHRIKIFLSKF